MTPAHHPTEAVLAEYAAGTLRPAFAIVVATHLERCPACREQVRLLEEVGGLLIDQLPGGEVSDESLARVMAGIERPLPESAAEASAPVVDRLTFGAATWIGPGMAVRRVRSGVGEDLLYQLRLPAGLTTIPHGHAGIEFTAVLKGAFEDGAGRFSVGDFAEMTEAVEHQPTITTEGECICLIASERPMRVQNWVGRAVHWLTGV